MTIANLATAPNLLADYAARAAATDRAGAESVAQRLKQAASEAGGFAPGTTITARYRYKVSSDGSLVAVQTQITAENVDALEPIRQDRGPRSRRGAREEAPQERAAGLRDYAPVKPQLAPSDEAAVFSALVQALPVRSVGSFYVIPSVRVRLDARITPATVEDENGTLLQAEVITSDANPVDSAAAAANAILGFSASFRQAQFSAASLYARSGEVVNQPAQGVTIAA